jgi:hypothetical protein
MIALWVRLKKRVFIIESNNTPIIQQRVEHSVREENEGKDDVKRFSSNVNRDQRK